MKLINKFLPIFMGCVFAFLLGGCATQLKAVPSAKLGQEQIFNRGIPTLTSRKSSTVTVSPTASSWKSNEKTKFLISIQNNTSSSFDVSTDDFSAFFNNRALKVYTFDEVASEIKSKESWQTLNAAIGGAIKSAQAGARAGRSSSYTSGTYRTDGTVSSAIGGSSYTSKYQDTTYGTSTTSTYNGQAAYAAQKEVDKQTQDKINTIKQEASDAFNNARELMLQSNTIPPGQSYGGLVFMEELPGTGENQTLDLIVNSNGEKHEFTFKIISIK